MWRLYGGALTLVAGIAVIAVAVANPPVESFYALGTATARHPSALYYVPSRGLPAAYALLLCAGLALLIMSVSFIYSAVSTRQTDVRPTSG